MGKNPSACPQMFFYSNHNAALSSFLTQSNYFQKPQPLCLRRQPRRCLKRKRSQRQHRRQRRRHQRHRRHRQFRLTSFPLWLVLHVTVCAMLRRSSNLKVEYKILNTKDPQESNVKSKSPNQFSLIQFNVESDYYILAQKT